MKTNTLAAILGFGFLAVGVMAFFWPLQFFNLWGDYYGTFNFHFVKDAGIAFFSSGLLLLASLKATEWRVPLTLGGALFLVLHGFFHIQMLFAGMVKRPLDIAIEIFIIITPSMLAALLLVLRLYERRVEKRSILDAAQDAQPHQ